MTGCVCFLSDKGVTVCPGVLTDTALEADNGVAGCLGVWTDIALVAMTEVTLQLCFLDDTNWEADLLVLIIVGV